MNKKINKQNINHDSKKESWYLLDSIISSFSRPKILVKNLLKRPHISVVEIIFDVFIIASFRHISSNLSFDFFTNNIYGKNNPPIPEQVYVTIFFIMQFLLLWIAWFFMIYFVQWFENYGIKSKVLFIIVFLAASFFLATQYMFNSHEVLLFFKSNFYDLMILNLFGILFLFISLLIMFISSFHELGEHQENVLKYFLKIIQNGFIVVISLAAIGIILLFTIQNIVMLWITLFIIALIIGVMFFTFERILHYQKRPNILMLPFKTNHLIERCTLMFCVAIGESIINFYEAVGQNIISTNMNTDYFKIILLIVATTLLVLALWWIYIDRVWTIRFHEQIIDSRTYLISNLLVITGVVLMAGGLANIAENFLDDSNIGDSSIFCLGFALFFVAISWVSATKNLIHQRGNVILKSSWSMLFAVDSIVISTLSLLAIKLDTTINNSFFILIILTGLSFISVFIGTWGWYKSTWMRALNKIHLNIKQIEE
ncbi:hypothetical protein ASO20_02835 [Mycoplasma sp. (ex Biomphalaria glabrata)]|uniref:low temperature requirement protein A n=1 Tax=Mycoplasma sp. (ex Biomphalaria glabrata) TaxID=1749074 RepID=UPI00073A5CBC|nr:low temperature requirement protein A [Mycoplasma sp. (ex Biomphalaria glabrata)]ALV23569.1 hypothetical protein ASO20_02835 [Mycoplasma sp. (ex Biomphalaria glabrata)]